jgi:hypothetical protein
MKDNLNIFKKIIFESIKLFLKLKNHNSKNENGIIGK